MRTPIPSRYTASSAGFTLLEVTAVVAIMLSLMIVLFIGANEYKKGADRAACIQNISTIQRSVRSFGNLYGVFPGETVTDLKSKLIGVDKFLEVEPTCPGDGTYSFLADILPLPGELYLDCSIPDHVPPNATSW